MGKKRMRLSVGAPMGCLTLPLGTALALITAFFIWMLVDQVVRFIAGGRFDIGTVLAFIGLIAIFAVVLYFVGIMAWGFLWMARTRIWLKGTVLVNRGIVLRRRFDLRTARVELRSTAGTDVAELFLIVSNRSGKSLDVLLQRGREMLPTPELAALARAIVDGQALARPVRSDYAEAMTVAERLRQLAVADA